MKQLYILYVTTHKRCNYYITGTLYWHEWIMKTFINIVFDAFCTRSVQKHHDLIPIWLKQNKISNFDLKLIWSGLDSNVLLDETK